MVLVVHIADGPGRLLQLRVERAARHSEQRAAFENAESRRPQREVFLYCDFDELVQRRIVEQLPPETQVDTFSCLRVRASAIATRLPAFEPLDIGFPVVGTKGCTCRQRKPERGEQ